MAWCLVVTASVALLDLGGVLIRLNNVVVHVAQYGRDDVSEPEHFYLKEQSNGAENRYP